MQCPACRQTFSYRDVPMEHRWYEALSAIFLCPNCHALLKPNRFYGVVTNLGLLLMVLSVFALLWNVSQVHQASYWLAAGLFASGLFLFVLGAVTVRLIVLATDIELETENDETPTWDD